MIFCLQMVKERVTAFVAPFMLYITLFLALGLLIFHSIEKVWKITDSVFTI